MSRAAGVTEGSETTTRFWERPVVFPAFIALIAFFAYHNSFQVPFVLDDYRSIVRNSVIRDPATFLTGAGYSYNPRRFIGYLTIALNYRLGGLDVTGYHYLNLAIHVVCGWLVYALGIVTLRTPFFEGQPAIGVNGVWPPGRLPRFPNYHLIAFFAALLFVVHPVQTQAVTYVIQRFASLCTLFYLLSLVLYGMARFSGNEGKGRGIAVALYLMSLASALLAMKTKEIAFTLPLAVVLYEVMFFRMSSAKRLLLLSPVLLTVLLVPMSLLGVEKPFSEIISDVAERTRVDSAVPRADYLFTQFRVLVTYLRLLFLPVRQNLDYDYPVYDSLLAPPVFLSLLLLLGLLGLAGYLFLRTRGDGTAGTGHSLRPELRLVSFGIVWFFLALSVESSLIPIADVIFEHRLYLAMPGVCLACATAFCTLTGHVPQRWLLAVAACAVVVLGSLTFARNSVWSDPVALARDTVEKSPRKARPHYNLAEVLSRAGWREEALQEATIAVRLDPRRVEPRTLMGTLYCSLRMYDKAIEELLVAVQLEPGYATAHNLLGDAFSSKVMKHEALEQYHASLRLNPDDPETCNRIGLIYLASGDQENAATFFSKALRLNPGSLTYRNNYALTKAH